MARAECHEAVIKEADFHQVFAQSTRVNVIIVGLGDAAKEVHGVRIAEVIIKGTEDESLGAEYLILGEAVVCNVAERNKPFYGRF